MNIPIPVRTRRALREAIWGTPKKTPNGDTQAKGNNKGPLKKYSLIRINIIRN